MYHDRTSSISARPLGRRAFLRSAAAASAGGAALYLTACGSSESDDGEAKTPAAATSTTAAPSPQTNSVRPMLLTGEHVVGQENRFLIGLLDGAGNLLKGADVHLRFFQIGADGRTGTFRFEDDATYRELSVEGAHTHDGSSGDAAVEDSVAFYAVSVPFDAAGRWGVEVGVTPESGSASSIQVPFEVLAAPKTPADGTLPPASQNDTAATNANSESLCSRDPICGLHDKVIGDVLGKGRPLVVQFSTPAYCETRFCGPVLEVLLAQVPAYQDRVDFVHIEVFRDFQLQQYRQAVDEWKLPGEPYTFFMDADGKVSGRLEAIFTTAELVERLEDLVTA